MKRIVHEEQSQRGIPKPCRDSPCSEYGIRTGAGGGVRILCGNHGTGLGALCK